MQHQLVTNPTRPSRAQIEPAALALLSRHSAGLLATARRYSACREDAEDAYQRGVEILLTKAPTTSVDDLLPWIKTVIKHESFAVRKSSAPVMPVAEGIAGEADAGGWTDERAERYEQLRVGAEAMAGLKPDEIRCLLLKAEGLSYREICEATGWSYTKVNRCLTEGRKAFLKRVAGIESGAECERLAPLISKVADGEASPEEMRAVRPHLKGCLACKATLREYRAAPSRLAGLVPPVVALAGGGSGAMGFFGRLLQRFGDAADAGGAKVAAVAASAALVAGGGAASLQTLHHDEPPARPAAASVPATSSADPAPRAASSPQADANKPPLESIAFAHPAPAAAAPPTVRSAATPSASTPAADPAPEFDPGTAAGADAPAAAPPPEFDPAPAGASGSASGASGGSAGSGSGAATSEFGP